MFCLCGPRKEQQEILDEQCNKSHGTSLQSNMKFESQFLKGNHNQYTEFMNEYDNMSASEERQQFEESKTNSDDQRLLHQGDGLLVRCGSIHKQSNQAFTTFIMKVVHDVKIPPLQEVRFVKQLVPNSIIELTCKRVKQDNLLISHDPTGSFLLKHLSSSQKVYYIPETDAFQPIISRAVEATHCQHKLQYVMISDIVEKVDTALINLLFLRDIPITGIIEQYLTLSHDLILVLSPLIEYHEMISQLRQGIKNSSQSHNYCSVEIQNVYQYGRLVAYIIYYGEVSQINQNQQLQFLYNCISPNIKREFKYKAFLRTLRSQIGIMRLVDLFSLYGLLNQDSEVNFKKFYHSVKRQYFPQIKSQRFIAYQAESNKSSTESENDEIAQIDSTNTIITEIKVYSKSESIHALTHEYVHFHSQNNRKSKHQEALEISQRK